MTVNLREKAQCFNEKTHSIFQKETDLIQHLAITPALIFLSKHSLLDNLSYLPQSENEFSLTTDFIIVGATLLGLIFTAWAIGRHLGSKNNPETENNKREKPIRISIKEMSQKMGVSEEEVIKAVKGIREKSQQFGATGEEIRFTPGRDVDVEFNELVRKVSRKPKN